MYSSAGFKQKQDLNEPARQFDPSFIFRECSRNGNCNACKLLKVVKEEEDAKRKKD